MSKSKGQREREVEEARKWLLETVALKPGDVIYTILRHVAASGMSRVIAVYVARENSLRYLTGNVANLLGWTFTEKHGGGIVVGGCGMDAGFHLVYTLGEVLFRGQVERAGYALKHEWL